MKYLRSEKVDRILCQVTCTVRIIRHYDRQKALLRYHAWQNLYIPIVNYTPIVKVILYLQGTCLFVKTRSYWSAFQIILLRYNFMKVRMYLIKILWQIKRSLKTMESGTLGECCLITNVYRNKVPEVLRT